MTNDDNFIPHTKGDYSIIFHSLKLDVSSNSVKAASIPCTLDITLYHPSAFSIPTQAGKHTRQAQRVDKLISKGIVPTKALPCTLPRAIECLCPCAVGEVEVKCMSMSMSSHRCTSTIKSTPILRLRLKVKSRASLSCSLSIHARCQTDPTHHPTTALQAPTRRPTPPSIGHRRRRHPDSPACAPDPGRPRAPRRRGRAHQLRRCRQRRHRRPLRRRSWRRRWVWLCLWAPKRREWGA